jgi:hypothetical protein
MGTMPALLFKCPITRQHVSAWVAETIDGGPDDDARLETITCNACRQVHLVHRGTEEVLGDNKE